MYIKKKCDWSLYMSVRQYLPV